MTRLDELTKPYSESKPISCPFCGGEAKVDSFSEACRIKCLDCQATSRVITASDVNLLVRNAGVRLEGLATEERRRIFDLLAKGLAISAWNRRSESRRNRENLHDSELIRTILDNPWHDGIENEKAKDVLDIYYAAADRLKDRLDDSVEQIGRLGKDVFRTAGDRRQAEWYVLKAVRKSREMAGRHAKTRVQIIYKAARFVVGREWEELIEEALNTGNTI